MGEAGVAERTHAEVIRDAIMAATVGLWLTFGIIAVVQIFTSGAKALDSLPPIWWWGVPLAPWTAMYAPWNRIGGPPANPPEPPPPTQPPAPEAAQ